MYNCKWLKKALGARKCRRRVGVALMRTCGVMVRSRKQPTVSCVDVTVTLTSPHHTYRYICGEQLLSYMVTSVWNYTYMNVYTLTQHTHIVYNCWILPSQFSHCATLATGSLLFWKDAECDLIHMETDTHTHTHLFLSAAFVTTAIISGVLMVSQTLLLREEEGVQSERSRTEGRAEEKFILTWTFFFEREKRKKSMGERFSWQNG